MVSGSGAETLLSVKCALEVVLPLCATRRTSGGTVPLDERGRDEVIAGVERLARRGVPLLAVAERASPARGERKRALEPDDVADLEPLGLLALTEPVRKEAAAAIQGIRQAGIGVAMVTGDHPSTAESVAVELGMLNGGASSPALISTRWTTASWTGSRRHRSTATTAS